MKTKKIYKNAVQLRERILTKIVAFLNPIYQALMPRNKAWKLKKADLIHFPNGTIGSDLRHFLDDNQFDLLPYLETHDIYHVLLGYKPTIVDEARMYFFLLGNKKYSFEVINTVVVSLILLPDYWTDLFRHYRAGKKCKSIARWDFRYLMYEKTEILRGIMRDEVEAKFFI